MMYRHMCNGILLTVQFANKFPCYFHTSYYPPEILVNVFMILFHATIPKHGVKELYDYLQIYDNVL